MGNINPSTDKNSHINEDYNSHNNKKSSSKSSTPRSKCTVRSSTLILDRKKSSKPKKRVSFNDDLIQVHLIPFNNYQNYLNIDQYKYQLKMMQPSDSYLYEDYEIPNEIYPGNNLKLSNFGFNLFITD